MPESFIGRFRPEQPAPDQTPIPRSGAGPMDPETAIVEREVARVLSAAEGTRNQTLNDASFNLAQILPADTWRERLHQAGLTVGLTAAETRATIASGIRGGLRNPRPEHRQIRGRNGALRPVEALPALDGYRETPSPFVDWEALWADPGEMTWLAEPVIPAGRLVSLYSPPGVGKSLLALDLAVSISRGTEALGAPTEQVPVLYLDYENVALDVRDRLTDMTCTPADLEALHYWSFPDLPPLDIEAGGQALAATASHIGAGLVVIDTLSRCIEGDENDAATMLNLYRHTLMPLKAAGIAVLRLDHTGKDTAKGQRGTSAKSGDVDLVWRYEEIAPGQFLLSNEKHRIRINELSLNIQRTESPTTHRVDTRTIGQAKRDAVLAAMDAAGLPADAGRDRARAVLNAAGIKIRDTTLADIIRVRRGLPAP